MTTPHHSGQLVRSTIRRPARCLHHTVWMACCDDCREAHAHLLDRPREPAVVGD